MMVRKKQADEEAGESGGEGFSQGTWRVVADPGGRGCPGPARRSALSGHAWPCERPR